MVRYPRPTSAKRARIVCAAGSFAGPSAKNATASATDMPSTWLMSFPPSS